jgi:hypothetical protein
MFSVYLGFRQTGLTTSCLLGEIGYGTKYVTFAWYWLHTKYSTFNMRLVTVLSDCQERLMDPREFKVDKDVGINWLFGENF